MEPFCKYLNRYLIFVAFLLVSETRSQTAEIIEVPPIPSKGTYLLEAPAAYPSVSVDVIWKITEEVDLKVLEFGIDAQSGDFILLSKYPLPNLPPGQIVRNLPVGEYIMLSPRLETESAFRLVNPNGVFVYFHGEYNEDRRSVQSGFKIELSPFDKPEEISTTTTESSVTPPSPGTDVYVQRFITGKTPYKFLVDLEIFKNTIASMTNNYIEEKGIERPRPTVGDDVKVPTADILYCDRGWPVYKVCVEVTFAIDGYDNVGNYIMTKPRIDEMWGLHKPELGLGGYAGYIPPHESEDIVAWVWVAGALGTILVFSVVLCFAWFQKANAELRREVLTRDAMDEAIRESSRPHYDRKGPIHTVLKTMNQNNGTRRKDEYVSSKTNPFTEFELRNRSNMTAFPGLGTNTYHDNASFIGDDTDEDVEHFNMDTDSNFDYSVSMPRFRQHRSSVPAQAESEH